MGYIGNGFFRNNVDIQFSLNRIPVGSKEFPYISLDPIPGNSVADFFCNRNAQSRSVFLKTGVVNRYVMAIVNPMADVGQMHKLGPF